MDAKDLLSNRARLTPDRIGLVETESGHRYTFAELNQRANRAANFLLSLGVGKGDRISILAHNSVVYVDLFYGAAKIGAVFAPLNWRLLARELIYIANDCMPKVLLCGPDFAETLQEMLPEIKIPHILSLNGANIAGASSYEEEIERFSLAEPKHPDDIDGESALCILYTSGTTGQPKGAIIPHRQVLWNCINTAVSWGLTENDVSPVYTPLFHAGGLFAFLSPLFYLGGRIILSREFDVNDSLRVIRDEKCTVILGVPTIFQMWMDSASFHEMDFSHVHFFISGGAPCPVPLIKEWRKNTGTIMRQGYGLSEVGPNCFTMTDEESELKAGSVGKPIFHSDMRLIDENGNEVGNGETGELLIRGPHVCSGYLNNQHATDKSIKDGWFHTGDMASRDEDGFYTIAGRLKDMIISGGENVYAAEVEAAFMEHSAVQECALIGLPNQKWGEVGLMVTVLKPGSEASDEQLKQHCQRRLAKYKVPKKIVFVSSLPHSPYGKVEKMKLKKEFVN